MSASTSMPTSKHQLLPPPTTIYASFEEAGSDEALLGGKSEGALPKWREATEDPSGGTHKATHGRGRLARGLLTTTLALLVVVGLMRWSGAGPALDGGLEAGAVSDGTTEELFAPAPQAQKLESELSALYEVVHDAVHQTTATGSPAAASQVPVKAATATPARPARPTVPLAAPVRPAKPQTPIRVGHRAHTNLYHGRGCNSSELLSSLAKARIRPDGASLKPFNYTSDVLPLDEFEFSYDLEGCPAPHHFTPEETCDLLGAFGGIYLRGDSLMRQFSQGLYLLLSNSFDIVRDDHEECSGNQVFTNGKECKFHSHFDGRHLNQVCGEQVAILYQQLFSWIEGPVDEDYLPSAKGAAKSLVKRKRPSVAELGGRLQAAYKKFIASLSAKQHALSPIYIHGTGIHYYFDTNVSLEYHIKPWLKTVAAAVPRPLSLWVLNPAPGKNKPKQFIEGQGETATTKYNAKMKGVLAGVNKGETEVAKGAWAALDYYNSTDGASSFDGTHYSYQVAMERAQILLNYLDATWSEVVELGGLVEQA